MAAPSLMFNFLESFRRSLLPEARFSAGNSPNTVWWPGSTDPLAAIKGPTSKGRGRERGKGKGGEGGEGRVGKEGEGMPVGPPTEDTFRRLCLQRMFKASHATI